MVLKGERFTVDLAETAEQQSLGLMFREEMADDHGFVKSELSVYSQRDRDFLLLRYARGLYQTQTLKCSS